jgi:NADH-quinone oxidoreductase subunit H
MGPLESIWNWLLANIHWITLTVVMHMVVLGTVAYLILFERKVAGWAQDRIGPNRTGFDFGILPFLKKFKFWGMGQSFADGLKMLMKEDFRSPGTDRWLFSIAPLSMIAVVIISIAVIPWGGSFGTRHEAVDIRPMLDAGKTLPEAIRASVPPSRKLLSDVEVFTLSGGTSTDQSKQPIMTLDRQIRQKGEAIAIPASGPVLVSYTDGWRFQIANLNIGVLFVLAVLSLAVYGVVVGGYASNNKYSFLGGLRATANMISYEIPLGLTILCIVLLFSTLDLGQIVTMQAGYWFGVIPKWNIFAMPLVFVLFLVCIHAEANRAPFDIAEAEQELVGGYHTEYSSMRFGLFFLAEYAGMVTTSAVCVALFFGGWHAPWIDYLWQGLGGGVGGDPSVTDSILAGIARIGVFFSKTALILFIFLWTRWSLPRFRFDQIMNLAWKMLIPIAIMLVIGTAIAVFVIHAVLKGDTTDGLSPVEAAVLLGMNAVVIGLSYAGGAFFTAGMKETNHRIVVPESRYA